MPPSHKSLLTGQLPQQCLAVMRESLPSPAPILRHLEQRLPTPFKQLAVELPLNRLFRGAIATGELDELEGRTVRLELSGQLAGVTLGFWQGRFRQVDGAGEATIRGSLAAFRQLAERRIDPDQLFFQRRLVIEGDTELGLSIKNLLDSLDWSLPLPRPLRSP